MGRIAGGSSNYEFRLVRMVEIPESELTPQQLLNHKAFESRFVAKPTEYGFSLPSVTTIIGETLGKPGGAMAWWGYRIGLDSILELKARDKTIFDAIEDRDSLEELLKEDGANPNTSKESAGDRGTAAHNILEKLAAGHSESAQMAAVREEQTEGTRYGFSVIDYWNTEIAPFIDSGQVLEVRSEVPVYSLEDRWCGTFDLALLWDGDIPRNLGEPAWEISDLKTHKPAQGFTKRGAAYLSDVIQVRAYRKGFEECGFGRTVAQHVVIARDRAYRGCTYHVDRREVPYETFRSLRAVYDIKQAFEKEEM